MMGERPLSPVDEKAYEVEALEDTPEDLRRIIAAWGSPSPKSPVGLDDESGNGIGLGEFEDPR